MAATTKPVSLTLSRSKDSPIHNPCFVIENWASEAEARVAIDSSVVEPGRAFRQGLVYNSAGERTTIPFLDLQADSPTDAIIRQNPNQN